MSTQNRNKPQSQKRRRRKRRDTSAARQKRLRKLTKVPKRMRLNFLLRLAAVEMIVRDHSHNDQANWVDEPSSCGRIRTVCRTCGAMIGYRPVGKSKESANRGLTF